MLYIVTVNISRAIKCDLLIVDNRLSISWLKDVRQACFEIAQKLFFGNTFQQKTKKEMDNSHQRAYL